MKSGTQGSKGTHVKEAKAEGQDEAQKGERIAKRMARAGLCSRRDAERWIEAGRVSVNNKVLKTAACVVTDKDRISVDGKELPRMERTRLWLLNKPSGQVTTNKDPEGRRTVFEALPETLPRVLSIGRLDINTEGLLLLTNDGGLARALELPSTGWLRRYRVRAYGAVTQTQLDELKEGIAVEGVLYGSIEAILERQQGHNVWLTFAMREGKNREVKKVLAALGLEVNRLIRISYGPFQLGDLETGDVQEVRGRTLRDQLGQKLIAEAGANFDAPINQIIVEKPLKDKDKDKGRGKNQNERGQNKHKTKKIDPLSRLDTKPNFNINGKDSRSKQGQDKSGKTRPDFKNAKPTTSKDRTTASKGRTSPGKGKMNADRRR